MPEYLHLPPVAQGVLAISAVTLAVVRLLTASRPFWAWEKVPVWVQKLLPALLMALAALPTAIEHARSWLDIMVGFVVTGSMWFTASRGDKRSTPPTDDQLEETVHFGPPLLVLLFVGLCLSQQACVGSRVDWPRVLQCAAPLEQPLLQTVASVLAGTGDVKTELEQVAIDHGAGVVECAVQRLIDDLASGPATARATRSAARGRAFLASVQR